MNIILKKALDSIKIQNFYITKGDTATKDVYVVYNYTSTPNIYADNKKQGDYYTILVNLYCKSGIEKNKKLVIDTLNTNGIKGGIAQATYLESRNGQSTGYYNTAITFNYFLRR